MKYNKFLGYHSSVSPRLEGLQKGDVLDESRYEEVIRDIFITYFFDRDYNVDQMNEYFESKGYGFTFVSDKPIKSDYGASKYKYGDHLYKVYGTGKEIIADDPNELNAEIVVSKEPLFFKKVDREMNESTKKNVKIYLNEQKIDSAIYAKKTVDMILSYFKALAKRELLTNQKYARIKLTGKRIGKDIINAKDAGSLSIKIRPNQSPFKGVFMKGMPNFYLILDDSLREKGILQITGQGFNELILIKIRSNGVIADLIDNKASQMDVYSALKQRQSTLYHELAHLYDYIIEGADFKDDDDIPDDDYTKYVGSSHEKYANVSEALSMLMKHYISDVLENLIKSHRKALKKDKRGYKNIGINEIIDIYGLEKNELKRIFSTLYFNKLSKYGVFSSKDQQNDLKNEYDQYSDKIQKKIIKNIKGILDGSVKDRSQLKF